VFDEETGFIFIKEIQIQGWTKRNKIRFLPILTAGQPPKMFGLLGCLSRAPILILDLENEIFR